MLTTHFIPYDQPIGGYQRALCGEVVRSVKREHSATPSCPDCAKRAGAPPLLSTAHDVGFGPTAGEELVPPPPDDDFHPPPEDEVQDAPPPDDDEAAPPTREAAHCLRHAVYTEECDDCFMADARSVPSLADVARSMGLQAVEHPAVEMVSEIPRNVLVVRDAKKDEQLAAIVEVLTPVVVKANAWQVTDTGSCADGEALFDVLRRGEQSISANCDEDCDRAHKVWKGLTEQRGTALTPVAEVRKALGDRIAAWRADQKAREDHEQRERERKAREEQEAAANREAKAALAAGDTATAAQILTEARTTATAPVPRAASALPSTGKTTTREKWIGEWDATAGGLPALLKAIGDRDVTEFDEALGACLLPLLTRLAPTLKGELGKKYPGVKGVKKPGLAGR